MWSFLSDKSLFQSDVKSETATFSTRSHHGNEKSKWSSTTTSLTSRGEMSLLKKHTARRCHSKSPQLLSGHEKVQRDGKSTKGISRTVYASCARNSAACTIRTPQLRSDLTASLTICRSRLAAERRALSPVRAFSFPACAFLRFTEPRLLWSERATERFTEAPTLRSAAWRRVRSTCPA